MDTGRYRKIVVLTGAGISAESGLSTFREAGGLWDKHRVEDVATPEAFMINPALVHSFYNKRRRELQNILPNAAHIALAELEEKYPEKVYVVTQNVDNLHEKAGTKNLYHMHGELLKLICTYCGAVEEFGGESSSESVCPACKKKGGMRPDIVWFGEIPKYMDEITALLMQCDLFISIGTSGAVYPAAGFVQLVNSNKAAYTVEMNLEPSAVASKFKEKIYGKASETVPEYVLQLLNILDK